MKEKTQSTTNCNRTQIIAKGRSRKKNDSQTYNLSIINEIDLHKT